MKISVKIFAIAGLIALFSSCQKENLPSPSGCPAHEQKTGNARIGDDSNTSGGTVFNGEVDEEVVSDSLGIVGGGDDDRDGGGIVGGGDADRDGGRRANDTGDRKK